MGTGYCLDEWTVWPHRNRIERGDESVHIAPKAMAVLDCLARASNSVVTRQEIFDSVWPGAVITDEVLTKRIAEIRKAFGDSAQQSKIIETIPKVGFRLIPPVIPLAIESESKQVGDRAAGQKRALKWFVFPIFGLLAVALLLGILWPDSPITQGISTKSERPVIAVLPFVNMSDDPDNEYFSDGISEELINLLANVSGLHVISRSSSFSFKGENLKMTDLASELNASLIVEGTVRKIGNQVRITAQLIDPATDKHLLSNSYDRELSDIFSLQEEIAQSIVTALQDEIGTHKVASPRLTENIEAYEIFLAGRHHYYQRGPALDSAIMLLQMAVEEDPEFADAWVYLAAAAAVTGFYHTTISNEESYKIAKHASAMALNLNPELGLALAIQAMLAWHYEGDLHRTFLLLDRAVVQNPHDSTIRLWTAMFYGGWGYRDESLHHYKTAFRIDPRLGIINCMIGQAYLAYGPEKLATQHLRKATELGYPLHYHTQASYLMMRGEIDSAFALLKSAYIYPEANPDTLAWINELEEAGRSYIENTDSSEALISVLERAPGEVPFAKARLSLFFDLKDQFFMYFSQAVRENHFWPMWLIGPLWLTEYSTYIEDPRFYEIMSWDGAVELWGQRGFPEGCIRVSDPAGDRLKCSKRYQ